MYIGTYRLGEMVPLIVQCVDGSGTPGEPDEAPRAFVASTSHVVMKQLPVLDKTGIDYMFGYPLSLDGQFSVGRYTIDVTYKISSTLYSKTESFEIVAGGDSRGRGIAMTYFKPHGTAFVLMQTDAGKLLKKKNPRVE